MNTQDRYLTKSILSDLSEKMVFMGGPRQVGKTTLAKDIIAANFKSRYFNWDKVQERKTALNGKWPAEAELIILDEFHKHPKWKTWIKGEYDSLKHKYKFLLTGSARLNIYRRGGDSLQGRYHYCKLHPLSLMELHSNPSIPKPGKEISFSNKKYRPDFETLFHFGGFPEPFFKQDKRFLRRWHNERVERFFKEDVRDLTMIKDFGSLALLEELLQERTSSVLSINSLAGDLSVNFRTVSKWLDVFEEFYYCFRLPSFRASQVAAVKKEKKLYLWDWSQIKKEGARLENLVASHLLKFCDYYYDFGGWKVKLHYLRDTRGREVDFLVCIENKPWFAVEVKTSDTNVSKNLLYFKERLNIPFCYQVVGDGKSDFLKAGVRVMSVDKFLSGLI